MLETSHIAHPQRNIFGPPKKRPVQRRTDADRLRQRKERRGKYQKRRAAGRCAYGSCNEKAEAGHSQCRPHLRRMVEHARQRRIERISRGLCVACGQLPQFWGRHCVFCRKVRSSNSLPYGARRALRQYREAKELQKKQKLLEETRVAIVELLTRNQVEGRAAEALRLYAGIDTDRWRTYRQVGQLMNLSGE